MSVSKTRPVLRWYGGKFRLAAWIVDHLPKHRIYVEPFGGAGSVLMRKSRSYLEVYNDLHDGVVTLFRILREPAKAARLQAALTMTPFSRVEFDRSYEPCDDDIEQARRLLIRAFMGFGATGAAMDKRTGFRAKSYASHTSPARDWATFPDAIPNFTRRLQGVLIEHRDALACMAEHDSPNTLHYVDPPYLPETRHITHRGNGYRHEMDSAQHVALLEELRRLRGMVVLSGYPSSIYEQLLPGWESIERKAYTDGAKPRVEMIWRNRAAVERCSGQLIFGEQK